MKRRNAESSVSVVPRFLLWSTPVADSLVVSGEPQPNLNLYLGALYSIRKDDNFLFYFCIYRIARYHVAEGPPIGVTYDNGDQKE